MKPADVSRWSAWLVCGGLGVQTGLLWLLYPGDRDAYTHAFALTRGLGWSGLVALCAGLCATPLGTLLRSRGHAADAWTRELRRLLGIAAAGAALAHAALAFCALPDTRNAVMEAPQLRTGLAGLLILLLLLITSFPRVVRALHVRSWKELHRLAYVAFALAFLHVLHAPYVPIRSALWLAALTLSVGLLRFVARQRGP